MLQSVCVQYVKSQPERLKSSLYAKQEKDFHFKSNITFLDVKLKVGV